MARLPHLSGAAPGCKELETRLEGLKGDTLRLASRVALVPSLADRDACAALLPFVMAGISELLLDELKRGKILESPDPPNFGHAKRWESARTWLANNAPISVGSECK